MVERRKYAVEDIYPENALWEFQLYPWKSEGACNGSDPSIFFPEKQQDSNDKIAKAICANCTVNQECLDYALEKKEQHGVWGGKNTSERQKLLKSQ